MGDAKSIRRVLVHAFRVSLFIIVILLVHWRFAQLTRAPSGRSEIQLSDVVGLMSAATSLDLMQDDGAINVLDGNEDSIGYVLQTSPESDHIVGFSGPTNVMIAFAPNDTIVGVKILGSGDTREHLAAVRQDGNFLASFEQKSRSEIIRQPKVDAVSGATLTSLAIIESVMHRLGAASRSLRFATPPDMSDIRLLFPTADHVNTVATHSQIDVFSDNQFIGRIIRTSPAADNIIGYQGPSDTLIALDRSGLVSGFVPGKSYDNEPYVSYVREDDYFRDSFNGLSVEQLAVANLEEMQVEGVSGATMTSLAVAQGIVTAAEEELRRTREVTEPATTLPFGIHDLGTLLVIGMAMTIGFTSLRANKPLRIGFQLLLVIYLGLIAGNLLSQAMIAGWAKHSVPWRSAAGLAMLAIAAFACPIFTKRNIYCSHLCPHGALQQLVKGRIGYQVKLHRTATKLLKLIPGMLLLWCLIVTLAGLSFSLVDIEPFDAYLFPIAGLATISVAIVGLVASLFVPMAYCRFGCPTGKLLEYLRYHAKSDRWSIRDWIATGYLILAVVIFLA